MESISQICEQLLTRLKKIADSFFKIFDKISSRLRKPVLHWHGKKRLNLNWFWRRVTGTVKADRLFTVFLLLLHFCVAVN